MTDLERAAVASTDPKWAAMLRRQSQPGGSAGLEPAQVEGEEITGSAVFRTVFWIIGFLALFGAFVAVASI